MRDSNPRSVSPHPVYSRDPFAARVNLQRCRADPNARGRRDGLRFGGPESLHPHHPREPRAAFHMTVPLAYAGWCVPGAHRAHRSSPPADLGVKVHSDKESLSSSQRSSASNPWGRSEVDGPLPRDDEGFPCAGGAFRSSPISGAFRGTVSAVSRSGRDFRLGVGPQALAP